MNAFQKAYAVAKAQYEVVSSEYNEVLTNNTERQAIMEEQYPLLDFEVSTPEYNRACEIEDTLYEMERAADLQTGYTNAQEVLRAAEEALVQWAFETLQSVPAAFKMVGIEFKDIEVLLPHMQNLYSPIRIKLIDLAFRYAA